jgi:hypothetical protein
MIFSKIFDLAVIPVVPEIKKKTWPKRDKNQNDNFL